MFVPRQHAVEHALVEDIASFCDIPLQHAFRDERFPRRGLNRRPGEHESRFGVPGRERLLRLLDPILDRDAIAQVHALRGIQPVGLAQQHQFEGPSFLRIDHARELADFGHRAQRRARLDLDDPDLVTLPRNQVRPEVGQKVERRLDRHVVTLAAVLLRLLAQQEVFRASCPAYHDATSCVGASATWMWRN